MAGSFVVNVEIAISGPSDTWLMIVRSDKEKHAAGMLSLVGGTVELDDPLDETLESVGRREVSEEVDVSLGDPLRYLESKMFRSDDGFWVIDVVFLGHHESGEPRAVSADEVAEVRWMTTSEILQDPRTPSWIAQSIRLADRARTEAPLPN